MRGWKIATNSWIIGMPTTKSIQKGDLDNLIQLLLKGLLPIGLGSSLLYANKIMKNHEYLVNLTTYQMPSL